jgi:hypothetical protein
LSDPLTESLLKTDTRILRVPFTGSVKLRALLLKAGPGDKTPAKVSLVCRAVDYTGARPDARLQFANENTIDFEDVADKTPTQEFDVPQGREVGEYQVRYLPHSFLLLESSFNGFSRTAKFTNISCITVFFPASQGADETRVYYLGFLGQWNEVSMVLLAVGGVMTAICIEEGGSDYHRVRSTGQSGGPREDTRDDRRNANAPAVVYNSIRELDFSWKYLSVSGAFDRPTRCRSILLIVLNVSLKGLRPLPVISLIFFFAVSLISTSSVPGKLSVSPASFSTLAFADPLSEM